MRPTAPHADAHARAHDHAGQCCRARRSRARLRLTPGSRLAVGVFAAAITVAACSGASAGDNAGAVESATTPQAPAQAPTDATADSSPALTPTPATASTTTAASPATTTSTSTTSTSTTTTTTTTSTTSTSTTTTSTTLPTGAPAATLDLSADRLTLGTSVEGRAITAERFGTVGGRRVLVIGVIHGNEDDGVAMIEQLRTRPVPEGVELWLVESMNPDGQAAQVRQNANQVDLNRNFPHQWGVIGEPGNSQYAGTGPASEPETQAMVNFITALRPDIAIWYHQDANLVIPSTGRDGRIRARYAELTGLPIADCCGGGGVYTGIAATWARNELKKDSDAVAFIVELPGALTAEQVTQHTDAVLTIAAEG